MENLTIFDLIEARRNPEEMTLGEIEKYLSLSHADPLFLKKLYADPRKGAALIAKRWSSKMKEQQRLEEMLSYEKGLQQQGYRNIAGVDEVGRGALAGPVVAAAVILDDAIPGVNDSKRLTPQSRKRLDYEIRGKAKAVGVGVVDVSTINALNIVAAVHLAMLRAVNDLDISPDYVLVDSFAIHNLACPQQGVTNGDSRCYSIAAASIVAKVYRDHLMDSYQEIYPEYGFHLNKGYGTQGHFDAAKEYGYCLIHRERFKFHNLDQVSLLEKGSSKDH